MRQRGTERPIESVALDGDGNGREADYRCSRDYSMRWHPPRDNSEIAARLGTLCQWTEDWIDTPDAHKRLTPVDSAVLKLLAHDYGVSAPPAGQEIDCSVRILRAYLLFWRALHAIAVRRSGFISFEAWPPTATTVCRSLNVSGVLETMPSTLRIVQAHNLVELFFASRRGSEEQLLAPTTTTTTSRSDDTYTRIVVGIYADGSRHFVLHNKHMTLTATDHVELDDGLIESERALGYSAIVRWVQAAVAADLPDLAGLEAVTTHHDLCPQAAAALHVCALQRDTLLVSQVAGVFSQSDLATLRAATARLARLLDRLHATPRNLQVATALAVARSCARLAEPNVLSCLCPEMVGLVVAARLLLVESPTKQNMTVLMDDAACALGLACARERGQRRRVRGIDIALALAAL